MKTLCPMQSSISRYGPECRIHRICAAGRPSHDSAMHNSTSMSISTAGCGGNSSTFDRKSGGEAGLQRSSAPGMRRSSSTQPRGRGSTESAHSEQTSGRSSFVMEQEPAARPHGSSMDSAARNASADTIASASPKPAAARGPQANPPSSTAELEALCMQMRVPPAMHARFLRLAVLHPNLPVPMQTLVRCCAAASHETVMTG